MSFMYNVHCTCSCPSSSFSSHLRKSPAFFTPSRVSPLSWFGSIFFLLDGFPKSYIFAVTDDQPDRQMHWLVLRVLVVLCPLALCRKIIASVWLKCFYIHYTGLNAQKLCVDGLGWMGMEISVSTSSKSTAVLITSWNVKWIWTADIEFDPDSIRVEHNINTAMPILFLDHVINKVVKVTVQCSWVIQITSQNVKWIWRQTSSSTQSVKRVKHNVYTAISIIVLDQFIDDIDMEGEWKLWSSLWVIQTIQWVKMWNRFGVRRVSSWTFFVTMSAFR